MNFRRLLGVMWLAVPTNKARSVAFLDWLSRFHPQIVSVGSLPPTEVEALQAEFERWKRLQAEPRKTTAGAA